MTLGLRGIVVFEKLPSEEFTQRVNFADALGSGETISSVTVSAIERASGADATSIVISGTPAVFGTTAVDYDVKAGSEGSRYLISIVVTLNTGEKREQWVEMRVPKRTA